MTPATVQSPLMHSYSSLCLLEEVHRVCYVKMSATVNLHLQDKANMKKGFLVTVLHLHFEELLLLYPEPEKVYHCHPHFFFNLHAVVYEAIGLLENTPPT